MVRNLIIALCATIMFSCSDKDTMQEIDAIYQEPVTLGILEQLQKDVKNSNSVTGKSNDLYITSCIDDRPEIVISGPISNPSSFVDGSDRLDLDFFTFENKNYVLIRSEDSLSYGLPDNYDRIHYIKESSNQLGVYRNDGHQASVSGSWDFLFNASNLIYLYEIDVNYNVIGGDKPLSTINIQCDAYEGWYAADVNDVDWSQGVRGQYGVDSQLDSLFIRLNSNGDYVGGGYLQQDSFFLENDWREDLDTRCVNSYHGVTPLAVGEYTESWGSWSHDGVTYYQYCIEEQDQYELKGYQLRSNGSTINFAWYPYGTGSLDYIGQVDLIKVEQAPNENALDNVQDDYESLTFVERQGNWFELEEEEYISSYSASSTFIFPKYVYVTETDISAYSLTDILLNTYSEIDFTKRNVNRIDLWNVNRNAQYFFDNLTNCNSYLDLAVLGNINDMNYRFHFINNVPTADDSSCTSNNDGGFYNYGLYNAISNPNITIN